MMVAGPIHASTEAHFGLPTCSTRSRNDVTGSSQLFLPMLRTSYNGKPLGPTAAHRWFLFPSCSLEQSVVISFIQYLCSTL